jgi:butyryl-CoA dehydrogenase
VIDGRLVLDPALAAQLRGRASAADAELAWPQDSLRTLHELGMPRWSIRPEFGGLGWPALELQEAYHELGRACLTTAFILSQREAAARRLDASRDRPIARELLPRMAAGQLWSTVGVAQLTSSRQHLGPTLKARVTPTTIHLHGYVPWVTGAAASEFLIVAAVDESGSPLLAVVPRDLKGLRLAPPMDLVALRGSCTTEVHFDDVTLDRQHLLEDRPERLNAGDGAGGLTTSCLALALAAAALDHLAAEAKGRPELVSVTERLKHRHAELWQELAALAQAAQPEVARFPRLRAAATQAALRTTQAALTASKGQGFVQPHPAQRWARQALFFLVWSCPRPTSQAVLEALCEI